MDQLVTREGRLFQVSDANGDFTRAHEVSGLYAHNTRFLDVFEVRVNGAAARPLAASVAEDDIQRVWAQAEVGGESVPHGAPLAVQRQRVLDDAAMYERIIITNYGLMATTVELELRFAADYADVFEVRGLRRPARGQSLPAEVDDRAGTVALGYLGLDGVTRRTTLCFNLAPASLDAECATWRTPLAAQGSVTLDVTVGVAEGDGDVVYDRAGDPVQDQESSFGVAPPGTAGILPASVCRQDAGGPREDVPPRNFDAAFGALRRSYADWHASCTIMETDSQALQTVLDRSALDLRLLLADLGNGPFPVAGIPWFAVPFGRDSLIAAIQALPLTTNLARGTLRTLAALQGREINAQRQEEPGKIPHELRRGEMANLNEVPFGRYYGSVDSTPLFLVLLCDYDAWTGDLALARELLPNIRAALHWIDAYGDRDGDLLLEFEADSGRGLAVQSWKDSADSLSHRDGSLATGAIAVAEVQGYVYDAKRRLAPLLARLGEHDLAERLSREAAALKERFNAAYWMPDRDYLALALDGAKRQVGTVTSDAGHCLWSGIVDAEKAGPVARRLTAPDLFSGWGIRTLATGEATYNPMSYHNGSVWPHDTSLCALGLKRYGYDRAANAVAMAVVAAARRFPDARLPELYCGFDTADGLPVPYPLACSPQAWAAGAPLALVRAMLGLEPDAAAGVLRLRPLLPEGVDRLSLRGLRVGAATVDLDVTRAGVESSVRTGALDVVVDSRES
jgi:glycogen debranching enzyme